MWATVRRGLVAGLFVLLGNVGIAPAMAIDLAKLNAPSPLGEMSLGPAEAKVTIIEYASASCPHCARRVRLASYRWAALPREAAGPGEAAR